MKRRARSGANTAVPCVISLLVAALYNIVDHSARALASTLISLLREIVFGVGLALLLPRFFGWTACFIPSPSPTR